MSLSPTAAEYAGALHKRFGFDFGALSNVTSESEAISLLGELRGSVSRKDYEAFACDWNVRASGGATLGWGTPRASESFEDEIWGRCVNLAKGTDDLVDALTTATLDVSRIEAKQKIRSSAVSDVGLREFANPILVHDSWGAVVKDCDPRVLPRRRLSAISPCACPWAGKFALTSLSFLDRRSVTPAMRQFDSVLRLSFAWIRGRDLKDAWSVPIGHRGGAFYALEARGQKLSATRMAEGSLARPVRGMLSLVATRGESWYATVAAGGPLGGFSVPTDAEGVQALFASRDLHPGSSRRAALLHWVRAHVRRTRRGPVDVSAHLRGVRAFSWNGLDVSLEPSAEAAS